MDRGNQLPSGPVDRALRVDGVTATGTADPIRTEPKRGVGIQRHTLLRCPTRMAKQLNIASRKMAAECQIDKINKTGETNEVGHKQIICHIQFTILKDIRPDFYRLDILIIKQLDQRASTFLWALEKEK